MTRARLRGATLIEVLVVTTVFSMLLVAIWGIYHSAVRAERLISLKTDIDRVIMAATRHLDSALKSSQLTQPNDWTDPQYVTELELTPLKLGPDGEPLVTAVGLPEWGDPFTISFENQELVRQTSERRVLANFGDEGSVRFIRRSKGMLEMEVQLTKEGMHGVTSTRRTTFQFRLFNQ